MRSPLEQSRDGGVTADLREARQSVADDISNDSAYSNRLITRASILPIQVDRQVDAIERPALAAGGASFTFPFQLTDGTVTLGSPQVSINYGTLQDNLPTGMSSPVAVATAGTWYVYLHLTVDINGVFVSAACVVSQTPMPANDDYDGYILLGQLTVASVSGNLVITVINQAATHSLRYGMCGRQVVSGSLIAAGTFEFWGF